MTLRTPRLSVIVVADRNLGSVRPTVAAMREQSLASEIEVLVVAPHGVPSVALDPQGLHGLEVVVVPHVDNRGAAAAAAVPIARAPVVALTENHCFAEPAWTEVILPAYGDPKVVGVGGAILNANPESTLSRTMHAAGYGQYGAGEVAGERHELPLHNSSYRREALLGQRSSLEFLLADERRLQAALLAAGGAFRFEPAARKRHINEATLSLLFSVAHDLGRGYATERSKHWSLVRRLVYGGLFPVLSLPILRDVWGKIPQSQRSGGPGGPLLLVAWAWALAHAVGEGATYLAGGRTRFPRLEKDEFLITERLGDHPIEDAWVAGLLETMSAPETVQALP